jgi:osmoprotectant transport system permease protein
MGTDALSTQLMLLPDYFGHHLALTMIALLVGVTVCLPLGALVTRIRFLQWPTLTAAGILQTIPGLALLALMVPLLGMIGFVPALIALTLYSFLPILRNTVTGILGVDPSVKEAARGIGMTDMQILMQVEWPLALPVIVAGVRTAAVWVVGTATLATPVGAKSLGNYIFSGLQTQNITAVLVGCAAAAALAITLDQLIRWLQVAAETRSRARGLVGGAALAILMVAGAAPWLQSVSSSDRPVVTIGSKPFSEQYILAALMDKKVQEAGFETSLKPGMGSMILFEALVANEIDCYVDYSGTIWTNVMKRSDTRPRDTVVALLTHWLDSAHGITCVGPLGFENTYALAVRRSTAERYNLETLDDLARVSHELSMGSDYEFFQRPEWAQLKTRYGLQFQELRTFDPSLMYAAVAGKDVDVISAYSTDGRIIDFDLVALADPRQALPPYDAVLLLADGASVHPQLLPTLMPLVGSITADDMREANRMVDQAGIAPDSAAAFLWEHMSEVSR